MPEPPEFRFGEGKISGLISLVLGGLCLGAVLCFRYPDWLTTPELRALYPLVLVRVLLFTSLLLSFALGMLCVVLGGRRRLALGGSGMALSGFAVLLGGAGVEVEGSIESSKYLGLDWLVLDLLVLALVFVPLERVFALAPTQRVFRRGWRTDLTHFGVSHLLVQMTVLLTMAPAAIFFRWAVYNGLQDAVASQPGWLQFAECLLVADTAQYGVHRLFHRVPRLWRFHAIHHSSRELDWLAGSRLHLVDVLFTRALGFVPLYVLGFSPVVLNAYLVFVAFHAVFIHANVRFKLGPIRYLLATPQYHHWHHTSEPDALDRNFAVHLPLLDWLFGTFHLPGDRWPESYGIEGDPVPEGYWGQLVQPFGPDRPTV
ncbi:MAG: sterol desaturase family protein [Proteobacteria bacterium]|nr:sterol desaturase family protein [Pseudomonadota bacterium]